jgi:hypothetical protein
VVLVIGKFVQTLRTSLIKEYQDSVEKGNLPRLSEDEIWELTKIENFPTYSDLDKSVLEKYIAKLQEGGYLDEHENLTDKGVRASEIPASVEIIEMLDEAKEGGFLEETLVVSQILNEGHSFMYPPGQRESTEVLQRRLQKYGTLGLEEAYEIYQRYEKDLRAPKQKDEQKEREAVIKRKKTRDIEIQQIQEKLEQKLEGKAEYPKSDILWYLDILTKYFSLQTNQRQEFCDMFNFDNRRMENLYSNYRALKESYLYLEQDPDKPKLNSKVVQKKRTIQDLQVSGDKIADMLLKRYPERILYETYAGPQFPVQGKYDVRISDKSLATPLPNNTFALSMAENEFKDRRGIQRSFATNIHPITREQILEAGVEGFAYRQRSKEDTYVFDQNGRVVRIEDFVYQKNPYASTTLLGDRLVDDIDSNEKKAEAWAYLAGHHPDSYTFNKENSNTKSGAREYFSRSANAEKLKQIQSYKFQDYYQRQISKYLEQGNQINTVEDFKKLSQDLFVVPREEFISDEEIAEIDRDYPLVVEFATLKEGEIAIAEAKLKYGFDSGLRNDTFEVSLYVDVNDFWKGEEVPAFPDKVIECKAKSREENSGIRCTLRYAFSLENSVEVIVENFEGDLETLKRMVKEKYDIRNDEKHIASSQTLSRDSLMTVEDWSELLGAPKEGWPDLETGETVFYYPFVKKDSSGWSTYYRLEYTKDKKLADNKNLELKTEFEQTAKSQTLQEQYDRDWKDKFSELGSRYYRDIKERQYSMNNSAIKDKYTYLQKYIDYYGNIQANLVQEKVLKGEITFNDLYDRLKQNMDEIEEFLSEQEERENRIEEVRNQIQEFVDNIGSEVDTQIYDNWDDVKWEEVDEYDSYKVLVGKVKIYVEGKDSPFECNLWYNNTEHEIFFEDMGGGVANLMKQLRMKKLIF